MSMLYCRFNSNLKSSEDRCREGRGCFASSAAAAAAHEVKLQQDQNGGYLSDGREAQAVCDQ